MRPLPPLLALGLLLAGCAAPPPVPPGGGPVQLEPVGEPIVQDHDHRDGTLHTGASNVARVGYHSGYGEGSVEELPDGQGFSEMAVWQGERDGADKTLVFLGRRNGPDGGFVVLDATDPANVTRLGAYPGQANYDVEVSTDGQFAFFTTQYLPQQGQEPQGIDPLHDQRAVYVVSLADLANPAAAFSFYPPTRGAHTITYHDTGSMELLLVNTYDFLPDPSLGLPVGSVMSAPLAHRTILTEFVRAPVPHLEVLSVFEKTSELPSPTRTVFPHDTYVQEHPLTGALLMYVGYWDLGAYVVDITDPRMPRELSQLNDFTPSQHASVHFARPAPELIDGVHLTVTEPELGPTDETGQLTFFDTTDPANPTRLGYWELPGPVVIDEGLNFSPHNFDIERGRIYLAHYHAGVWVVDVHNRSLLDRPESLGYDQRAEPRSNGSNFQPMFWSAFLQDGLIYASDESAGLKVLRFALDA